MSHSLQLPSDLSKKAFHWKVLTRCGRMKGEAQRAQWHGGSESHGYCSDRVSQACGKVCWGQRLLGSVWKNVLELRRGPDALAALPPHMPVRGELRSPQLLPRPWTYLPQKGERHLVSSLERTLAPLLSVVLLLCE